MKWITFELSTWSVTLLALVSAVLEDIWLNSKVLFSGSHWNFRKLIMISCFLMQFLQKSWWKKTTKKSKYDYKANLLQNFWHKRGKILVIFFTECWTDCQSFLMGSSTKVTRRAWFGRTQNHHCMSLFENYLSFISSS